TIDGVRKNYGHIGVRYPDGRFWSDGSVYASVEEYERLRAPVFVGWGESVNDVRVIEEVKGGSMEKTNLSTARILTYGVLGRVEALSGKHDADLNKHHVNVTLNNSYIGTLHNSTEAKNWRKTLEEFIKKAGERDVFAAQVSAKDAQIKDLNSTLKIKDNEINRLNKEVESLKAQTGDN